MAKSKSNPGPAPTKATTTIEAAGAGTKVSVDQEMSDGTRDTTRSQQTTTVRKRRSSGKSRRGYGGAHARQRVDCEDGSKKAGKETTTQTSAVSSDGKTRTVTTTGINGKGQKVNNVAVYERQ